MQYQRPKVGHELAMESDGDRVKGAGARIDPSVDEGL